MNTGTFSEANTFKKILLIIPFVIFGILCAGLFFLGIVALFYGFASIAAFHSAMIALVLIGGGLVCIALGMALITAAIAYGKYLCRPKELPQKTSSERPHTLKDVFSLGNITLVVLAIGALFVIVSALLGATERDRWVEDTSKFMDSHGYFSSIHSFEVADTISPHRAGEEEISVIALSLKHKQAVIVYTDDADKRGLVTINGYTRFERQIGFSRSAQGKLTVTENEAPKQNDAVGKIMFFAIDLFGTLPQEDQVIIYLPRSYEGKIELIGEYILAK